MPRSSRQRSIPSKHQVLKRLIEISDDHCMSSYYADSFFSDIPKAILCAYFEELAQDGYIKPLIRNVRLLPKAYSYSQDRRKKILSKALNVLGRPITYLITWILGIVSALLIQYLADYFGLL